MTQYLLSAVAVVLLTNCRTTDSSTANYQPAAPQNVSEPTLALSQIHVEPINGGINTAFHGYRLEVSKVLLGGNPCLAGDAKAEIELRETRTQVIARVIVKNAGPRPNVRCTREARPVYSDKLSIDVRSAKTAYLENVERQGQKKKLADLVSLSPKVTLECAAQSAIVASQTDLFKFTADAASTKTEFYTRASQLPTLTWTLHDPAAALKMQSAAGVTKIEVKASEKTDFSQRCWQPVTRYELKVDDSAAGAFTGEVTVIRSMASDPRVLCAIPRIALPAPVTVKLACTKN
jgi:hypothetical protein